MLVGVNFWFLTCLFGVVFGVFADSGQVCGGFVLDGLKTVLDTLRHSSPLEGGRERKRERENACLAPTHVGRTGAHDGASRHGSSKTNRRAVQYDWCTRSGVVVSYLPTRILTQKDKSQMNHMDVTENRTSKMEARFHWDHGGAAAAI